MSEKNTQQKIELEIATCTLRYVTVKYAYVRI